MRRALSILLVLFFGFGPLAATLNAGDDARLPACCRRHGAHHCAMSQAAAQDAAKASSARLVAPSQCPLYPHGSTAALAQTYAVASPSIGIPFHPPLRDSSIETEFQIRNHAARTHSGRGPPIAIPSSTDTHLA